MRLSDWLRAHQCTDRELAVFCGSTTEAARLWRFGMRRPSPNFVDRIVAFTHGEVTESDLESAWRKRHG